MFGNDTPFAGPESFLAACKDGQSEEAESILKRFSRKAHAHPWANAYDSNGRTALMIASQEGHCEIVRLLLRRGAQVDLQDSKGWSALMLACRAGHCEVAAILLESGADVDLQSVEWESAHSLALSHHNHKISNLIEKKVKMMACRNSFV